MGDVDLGQCRENRDQQFPRLRTRECLWRSFWNVRENCRGPLRGVVRRCGGNRDEERYVSLGDRLRVCVFGLGPVPVAATGAHADNSFRSEARDQMKRPMRDPVAIPRQLGPDAFEISPDVRSVDRESVHTGIVSPSTRPTRPSGAIDVASSSVGRLPQHAGFSPYGMPPGR